MFIHFGLYSLLGRGEQVLYREHLSHSEYRKLADKLTAPRFNADEWVRIAKDCGMRYMVMTAKHCDGFCLFDTSTTDYNSMKKAAKKDFIYEYVKAARKAGIRVGIYYSPMDWNDPAYFRGPEKDSAGFSIFLRKVHEQIRELCTNYGKIDELWFDGDMHMWEKDSYPGSPEIWQSEKILKMVRKLQPGALVNERLGIPADIQTSERHIGKKTGKEFSETCMVSQHRWWGYMKGDRNWHSAKELIEQLCFAAAGQSNYLLNVGPMGDGRMPSRFIKLTKEIGRWMKVHGDAIYGAEANPGLETQTYGNVTCKGKRLFIHILYWPEKIMHLPGIKNNIITARIVSTDRKLKATNNDGHIIISGFPVNPPDKMMSVIELELDGKPRLTEWAKMHLWTTKNKSSLANWVKK